MTVRLNPRRRRGAKPAAMFAAVALFTAASLAGTVLAARLLDLWLSGQPIVDLRL